MKKLVYGIFALVAFSFIVPDTSFAAPNPPPGKKPSMASKIMKMAKKHNAKGRAAAAAKAAASAKAAQ